MDPREATASGGGAAESTPKYSTLLYVTASGGSSKPIDMREAAALLSPGGRLILVDFAPHEMEFLRTEHAHRRLGFEKAEVVAWFAEAGLECDLAKEVTAADGVSGQLGVMLWRGRDRRLQGDFPIRQFDREVA